MFAASPIAFFKKEMIYLSTKTLFELLR